MVVVAMAQILMSFNINALRVAVGGIVASFNTSPTTVGTAINLDDIAFVSNEHLLGVLEETTAAPEQVSEAVRINTEGRSRALRICFLALTGLALIAIFPAGGLPGYHQSPRAERRQ